MVILDQLKSNRNNESCRLRSSYDLRLRASYDLRLRSSYDFCRQDAHQANLRSAAYEAVMEMIKNSAQVRAINC